MLAELLDSFGTSADIFRSSISALSAICQFDAHVAHMMSAGIAAGVVGACSKYFTQACEDDDVSQDTADNMETAFQLMTKFAAHSVGSFAEIGGVAQAVSVVHASCTFQPGRPSKFTNQYLSSIAMAAGRLLDTVSRSKAGMDYLLDGAIVEQLLASVSRTFQGKGTGAVNTNDAKSTFRRRKTKAVSSSDDAENMKDKHLAPLLRLLDRLSRTSTGLGFLQASGAAVTQLSATMTIVQGISSMSTLVVRLLGRILEGDFSRLLTTVEGYTQEGGVAEEADRVLAARMLASLLQDEEYVEAVARAGAGEHVQRLLGAARDVDIPVAKASLFTALRELAAFSTDNRAMLARQGLVPIAADAAAQLSTDALLVSEAAQCLAETIDCREIADLLISHTPSVEGIGEMSGIDLVGYLVTAHAGGSDEGDACGSALLLTERLALFECTGDEGWCNSVIASCLQCLQANVSSLELQAVGVDVLIYLACTEGPTRHMVEHGAIGMCIANLRGEHLAKEEGSDMTDTRGGTPAEASLVASCLYLMASLCTVPDHVPRAKAEGCIRGVLAGFTRFPEDGVVYVNFRDVIRVLNISPEEVMEAVHRVNYWARQLREMFNTSEETWKPVADLISMRGAALPEDTVPEEDLGMKVSSMTMTAAAEMLLEGISLLEAVAVSPVLVAVIVRGEGIDMLLHTLLIVCALKTIKRSGKGALLKAAGKALGAKGKFGAGAGLLGKSAGEKSKLPAQGVLSSVQDEVLSRACSTLSQLARVAYEVSSGDMSNDLDFQEYDEVNWGEVGLKDDLYSRRVTDAITHAMSSQAALPAFAANALTLVSWLAVGHTPLETRSQVELLISSAVVEACVALLRAHQDSLQICSDAAGALLRVASIGRGAVAVATRGASRQLIRMLGPTARKRSHAGDALLLSFLHLLEACTAAGESAAILRKQGLVDAVVEAVEGIISGTSFGLTEANEEGSAQATGTGQRSGHIVRPATRSAIEEAVQTILSALVDKEEVISVAHELDAQKDALVAAVAEYQAGTSLVWPTYQFGRLSALASKFGLLAGTDAAERAGSQTLAIGAMAIQSLGAHAVYVMQVDEAGEVVPDPSTCQAEMQILLPVTLRSMRQVLLSMGAGLGEDLEEDEAEAVQQVAIQCADFVVSTVRDHPMHSGDGIAALAAIASEPAAAALLPGAADGAGMDIILSAFRRGGLQNEERLSTAAMQTLRGIAAVAECKAYVTVPEVITTTLTQLGDTVNEAGAPLQSAAVALLALVADDEVVLHELTTGGIFGIIRTILTRHCGDPYTPNEMLLQAVAELLPSLVSAQSVLGDSLQGGAEGESASGARSCLRRVANVSQSSTGYLDTPECMVAVLKLIAHACTSSSTSPVVAAANQEALMQARADDMVVQAMSSSTATPEVLSTGRRALAALGLSSKFRKYVGELSDYCENTTAWLEAGYDADCDEITSLVSSISDVLRNMSAMLVSGDGEEGDDDMITSLLEEVSLTGIFGAVQQVISTVSPMQVGRNDTALAAGTALGDCYTKRADCLAVGVQTIGRLANLVPRAIEARGPDAVEGVDASTIIDAAHSVLRLGVGEVRVVESSVRALMASLGVWASDSMTHVLSSRMVPTLTRLTRIVRRALAKAKLAGSNAKAGKVGPMSHLSVADLTRLEAAMVMVLRELSNKHQELVAEPGVESSIASGRAFVDMLICSAIGDPPGEDPIGADDDGDLPYYVNSVLDAPNGTTMQWEAMELLPEEIKSRTVLAGGMFASSSERSAALPDGITADEEEMMSLEGAQARVRVLHALLRAVVEREVPEDEQGLPVGPDSKVLDGHVARLRALFSNLKAGENLAYGTGRKWKRKVLSADGETDTRGVKPLQRFKAAVKRVMMANRWGGWEVGDNEHDIAQAGELESASNKATVDMTIAYGCGVRNLTLRLLSRIDVDTKDAEAQNVMVTPSVVGDVAELLMYSGKHPTAELVSGEPEAGTEPEGEQPDAVAAVFGGVTTEALRVVARLAGLYAPQGPGIGDSASDHKARIHAMAKLGIFNATALALRSQPNNLTFAREAVLLLNGVCSVPEVGVTGAGLKQEALLAMQATVRAFAGDQVVSEAGSELVLALSEVYAEQSGRVFGDKCGGAAEEAGKCTVRRYRLADGSYEYDEGGSRSTVLPASFKDMFEGLMKLNDMSRMLDETAVVRVPPDVISRMVDGINTHKHDPGVVGIIVCALGKLCENEENHEALMANDVVPLVVSLAAEHSEDPKVCSGVVAVLQPLSFDPDHTIVISNSGCTRLLTELTSRFEKHMSRFCGPPLAWPLEGHEEANQQDLMAAGAGAEEKNELDPRIAKVCVQTLANLACANEPEALEKGKSEFAKLPEGPCSVDVIVAAGGIRILGSLMASHMTNPRLLEDAMCALSNIAYVSVDIQLEIGRVCIDTVVGVALNFHNDEHLFRMALRAIGNLTRCDENIMRVVGYGAIDAIVKGMAHHKGVPEVLQLAADVIGNLASVDETRISFEEGNKLLTECNASRHANDKDGSTEQARAFMSRIEGTKSPKEAVCTCLYEDGGPKALLDAIQQYNTNEELVTACLRALHYAGAGDTLIRRMIEEQNLVDRVVLAMRSCDFNTELLRRGVRVLGQALSVESARDYVLRAGVPQVLLTAIDTHHKTEGANVEKAESAIGLCSTCYAVLHEIPCEAVFKSVREIGAISTTLNILEKHMEHAQYSAIILSVLDGWCVEPDLSESIARLGVDKILKLALKQKSDVFLLASVLQFVAKLAKREQNAKHVLNGGGMRQCATLMDDMLKANSADKDAEIAYKQRPVTMQVVSMISNITKAGKAAVRGLLEDGAWRILTQLKAAYEALQSSGQIFYDRETCENITGIMEDMRKFEFEGLDIPGFNADGEAAAEQEETVPPLEGPAGKVLKALLDKKFGASVWTDDCKTKVRVNMSFLPVSRSIVVEAAGTDTGKIPVVTVHHNDLGDPILELPPGVKAGGVFSKGPNAKRIMQLVDKSGAILAVVEPDSDKERSTLVAALEYVRSGGTKAAE